MRDSSTQLIRDSSREEMPGCRAAAPQALCSNPAASARGFWKLPNRHPGKALK
jgi:hypothetical protein